MQNQLISTLSCIFDKMHGYTVSFWSYNNNNNEQQQVLHKIHNELLKSKQAFYDIILLYSTENRLLLMDS